MIVIALISVWLVAIGCFKLLLGAFKLDSVTLEWVINYMLFDNVSVCEAETSLSANLPTYSSTHFYVFMKEYFTQLKSQIWRFKT